MDEKYKKAGILPHWKDKTWEDFSTDNRAKDLMTSYVASADEALSDKAGFFICGGPGVGKSLLAMLVAKSLVEETKHRVRVFSFSGLIDLYKETWTSKEAKDKFKQLVQITDFLFIEDFGKEYVSKDDEGRSFPTTVLEEVISKRNMFNKVTFIVSSIDAKFVSKAYSEGLYSLIKEVCVPIRIEGSDYRSKINKEKTLKWRDNEQRKRKS